MPQKLVMISDGAVTSAIFGTGDENARRIEERFSVRIEARSGGADSGDCLAISGEDAHLVEKAGRVLEYLSRMVTAGDYLEDQTVDYVIETISADAFIFREESIIYRSWTVPLWRSPAVASP